MEAQLKQNKEIYEFVGEDGWKHVKQLLMEKIEDLQSTSNVNLNLPPEEVVLDLKVRSTSTDILMEWLREVEGTSEQYEQNELEEEVAEVSHIIRSEG